ncbi:MAG: hypothetical protein HRT74_02220 [Flavobacteriales bacterium]|nr:hypothetical protein [Flavobacteriales bacterium]
MRIHLLKLLFLSSFAIAMGHVHGQNDVVADWLEPYEEGWILDGGTNSDDSLRISTKYLYGSVVRAIGANLPEYQELTSAMELAVMANSNTMPMTRLQKEKDMLSSELEAEGMQVLFEARNKGMDIGLFATSDEDVVEGFVVVAITPEQQLMVFDFKGSVNVSEVLGVFMGGNLDQLNSLMDITKNLDFD